MGPDRIARILDDMGALLELRGENPFRCRAYHTAAQAIEALPRPLGDMLADGTLKDVPGIGATLLEKITRLATTGNLPEYDELQRETPPGLRALSRVPGLGPSKIKVLRDALGITGIADLKAAAEAGTIAGLKGFGAKTQTRILEGIAFLESAGDRILQSTARRLAEPLLAAFRAQVTVLRAEVCGSLRRRKETIGDLDLLFSAPDPAPVLDAFLKLPGMAEVLAHGPTKVSVRLDSGIQCDVRGVADDQFAFALNYFTGSKEHNIALRRRAQQRELKLSEYTLEGPAGPIACATEAELYAALDLAYIPPELRENHGEIERAERGALPELITLKDLAGTFHCHTDWSDGGATLEEMAAAARSRGLGYLGIADHSRSAAYAGGLSIERVREQWERIDALNHGFGKAFRLFKGIECDILADGTLDYPDDVLAGFDYVVASVHSQFGLSREAMTARVVRAVEHPLVTMLGHPTGRLLLARDAYAIDLDAVIAAAAKAGTMIEINANPHRLDLDAEHARKARDQGVMIVINPDAHAPDGIDDLFYGIGQARRAGLAAADVFNTLDLAAISKRLEDRVRRGRERAT